MIKEEHILTHGNERKVKLFSRHREKGFLEGGLSLPVHVKVVDL